MLSEGLALRVDVDTRRGLERGVPRLLDLFASREIAATFFIPFGPDRSGRAVRRLFEQPGFLRRMWRLGAPGRYGLRTILSGTLIPSVPIGSARPDILRSVAAEGHEVGLHGYDHVRWQDRLGDLTPYEVALELEMASRAYQGIFGQLPRASAAPGWRTNERALLAQETLGLHYASDVRGRRPFWPVVLGRRLETLQIPVTMPTLDEIFAWEGPERRGPERALLGALVPGSANVLAVHAEIAGGSALPILREFISMARDRGYSISRLEDLARDVLGSGEQLPSCGIGLGRVPGRAGMVAVQAEVTEPAS
ncbi:hypothetical protein AMJ39_02320 [candidate division TA06 bacterium DG_24]|uniref:NodB homology domain-containing protein n=2 Tax=Bacteria division TA06 TaxID=1156500 RepID=A0A0S8G906_UNCT6|nr:MAG: hypothetical protein AMJ39_02320 [candidate division TA06 bacterium DG_24]KPK69073.1 MAG: hypothetical protein AMJ82_06570 [candidate division TA06 bacterium SM23_40]